jgi:hypothetical protein
MGQDHPATKQMAEKRPKHAALILLVSLADPQLWLALVLLVFGATASDIALPLSGLIGLLIAAVIVGVAWWRHSRNPETGQSR